MNHSTDTLLQSSGAIPPGGSGAAGETDCCKTNRRGERQQRKALQQELQNTERSCNRWALAALAMSFIWVIGFSWEQSRHAEVVSSQPIGHVTDLQPAPARSGLRPVVQLLSTDRGFYSLLQPITVVRGQAMVLETRASGRKYVCAADRRTCSKTEG